MSVFASKGRTSADNGMSLAEAHAMLGKCRSKSARLKSADRRESAGDKAGAAKQRSYANRGITTKQEAGRAKRAKELVAQRAAKQAELKAKVAASPTASAPKAAAKPAPKVAAKPAPPPAKPASAKAPKAPKAPRSAPAATAKPASRPAINPAVAASIAARRARQAAPDRAAKINELRTERAARTIDREFAKAPGGNRNFVTLESLRARMPHIKREEFDAGMHKLRMDRTMSLAVHEGMSGPATPGMRAAAIVHKGGGAGGVDDIYMYTLRREGVPRRKVSRVAKGGILKGS